MHGEVVLCCTEKPPTHFRISRDEDIDAPGLRQLLACIAVLALHVAEEENVSAAEVLLHLEDPAATRVEGSHQRALWCCAAPCALLFPTISGLDSESELVQFAGPGTTTTTTSSSCRRRRRTC